MKIHCFRHAEFEFLGHISSWVALNECQLRYTDFFAGELPPSKLDADLLVILGGPMGVNDEKLCPWLLHEKKVIEQAMEHGTRILGICLGAQLIASVMGADVRRNPHQEIGWHSVVKEEAIPGTQSLAAFPLKFETFQWHGDTFEIPKGAVRTFSSPACSNQGFTYGEQIVGFQFHPEIDHIGVQELVAREYHDVAPGPWIQSPLAINDGHINISSNREMLFRFLNSWSVEPLQSTRCRSLEGGRGNVRN